MLKSLKINKLIRLLVILLISLSVVFSVYKQKTDTFQQQTNFDYYANKYFKSQYVLGEISPNKTEDQALGFEKIDDSTLYIYAGFSYLNGQDPTTINFEHPPLTKYLLGLSLTLFNNPVILNLLLFFLTLLCVFYLTRNITNSYWFGLTAVIMVGSLKILQEHVAQALMDFPQLFLTLLLFTVLFSKLKFKYLLTGLVLGGLLAVKYQIPMIFLYLFIVFAWAISEKKIKQFILAIFLMVGTYLLTYVVYFVNGHNLIDFAKFEWYRFRWFTGDRTMPKFLIWQTLFTGSFKTWWDNGYLTEPSWSIFWPISFVTQLFYLAFWQKFDKKIMTLFFYTTSTLIVFSIGSAAYARYLLQLLPFWIIISLWLIQQLYLTKGLFKPKKTA